jgi:hypothetical protein
MPARQSPARPAGGLGVGGTGIIPDEQGGTGIIPELLGVVFSTLLFGGPAMAAKRFIARGLAMALILAVPACTSGIGQMSLKESFTLSKSEALLKMQDKSVLLVEGDVVHTAVVTHMEHGETWQAGVWQGKNFLGKWESWIGDNGKFQCALPTELKGVKLFFFSHDGNSCFGRGEYFVWDSDKEPDLSQGITVMEGGNGVTLLNRSTPGRKAIAETYAKKQVWLQKMAKATGLEAQFNLETFEFWSNLLMLGVYGVEGAASFGWATAIDQPGMYEERGWKDVWKSANYLWSFEKALLILGRVFGLSLAREPWKGHLASSLLTQRANLSLDAKREQWLRFHPALKDRYWNCVAAHAAGGAPPPRFSVPTPTFTPLPADQPSGAAPSGPRFSQVPTEKEDKPPPQGPRFSPVPEGPRFSQIPN